MDQDEIVLCGASAYTRKFYFNEEFSNLPEQIKEDLQILCVLYTEDVGGALQLYFDEEGTLCFRTESREDDFTFDEIGSVLKIKQIQQTRQDMLEALEMYFKVFFLGEGYEEE